MLTFDKSALVLDSCAFVHLSNCFVREKSLIDFLVYDLKMNVYVSSSVHEEIRRLLSAETPIYIEQADKIFNLEVYIRKTIKIQAPPKECTRRIRSDTIEITKSDKKLRGSWLDRGERDSAALALCLSKKFNVTFFITGDFKAIKLLRSIFGKEEIGRLQSSYDLCVFLYSRGLLRRDQVERILFSIEESMSGFETGDVSLSRVQGYRDKISNICNFDCVTRECFG